MGKIRRFNESNVYKLDFPENRYEVQIPPVKLRYNKILSEVKSTFQEFEDSDSLKEVAVRISKNLNDSRSMRIDFNFSLLANDNIESIKEYYELIKDIYFRLETLSYKFIVNEFFTYQNDDFREINLKLRFDLS